MFIQKIRLVFVIILCTIFLPMSCMKTQNNNVSISDSQETTEIENTKEEIINTSDYSASISDLNGTWLPNWSYEAGLKMTEEENEEYQDLYSFSWGVGKIIVHTTFEIDISAEKPFFRAEGDGIMYVTEITQISNNSIKVNVYHGIPDEPHYWNIYIFHFIDENSIWIENEKFENMDNSYGKGKLWHRLSGPEESE